MAESLSYLAGLYTDLADYDQALLDYQRALSIREEADGKDSLEAASILRDMGDLLTLMGREKEASAALKRCLSIQEKAWGSEDMGLVETLGSLFPGGPDRRES